MLQLRSEPCPSPSARAILAGLGGFMLLGGTLSVVATLALMAPSAGVVGVSSERHVAALATLATTAFLAPCALVLIHFAFRIRSWFDLPAIPQSGPDFDQLDGQQRLESLNLAWAGPSPAVKRPHPPPGTTAFFTVANMLAIAAWVFCGAVASIAGALFAPDPTADGGWLTFMLLVLLVPWLIFCMSAVWHVLRRSAAANAAFAPYGRAFEAHCGAVTRHWFRDAAVRWTWKHYEEWLREGGDRAYVTATKRLGLPEATPGFRLTTWAAQFHDMPPPSVPTLLLLVGDFLGVRQGTTLDVRQTSYAVSGGQPVVIDERGVREREVYYQDIVVIDYERKGPGWGDFKIRLSDGTEILDSTTEANVDSALQAVRERTRMVKAAKAAR